MASAGADLPRLVEPCRLALRHRNGVVTAFTLPLLTALLIGFIVAMLLLAWWVPWRARRRQHALSRLLDAADALEQRLRDARSELEQSTSGDRDGVQDALQEMLRQRLWLQQHGEGASVDQLDQMRQSIDAARERLDQQLVLIERARATTQHP